MLLWKLNWAFQTLVKNQTHFYCRPIKCSSQCLTKWRLKIFFFEIWTVIKNQTKYVIRVESIFSKKMNMSKHVIIFPHHRANRWSWWRHNHRFHFLTTLLWWFCEFFVTSQSGKSHLWFFNQKFSRFKEAVI